MVFAYLLQNNCLMTICLFFGSFLCCVISVWKDVVQPWLLSCFSHFPSSWCATAIPFYRAFSEYKWQEWSHFHKGPVPVRLSHIKQDLFVTPAHGWCNTDVVICGRSLILLSCFTACAAILITAYSLTRLIFRQA